MSAYLARLKNIHANNLANTSYTEPTEPTKGAFDGFVCTHMGNIVKNNSEIEITSIWWLLHFVDREPMQVTIKPPCNQSIALSFHPDAIVAEPLDSPIPLEVNLNGMNFFI